MRAPADFYLRISSIGSDMLACAAGVLACLDGYMNIAMEQTEEYVNGQLKAKYGDTFIRGNNGARAVVYLLRLVERKTNPAFRCARSALHQHAEEAHMRPHCLTYG